MTHQNGNNDGQNSGKNSVYYEEGHYKNQVILCSSGFDHTIRFWNADQGFCERIIQGADNSHVNSLAISPNRDMLASVGFQNVRLYDIDSGNTNPIINFDGISKNVSCVGFNQNGNYLFSGGEDGLLRLSDIRVPPQHKVQHQRAFQTPINSAFWHPNGVEVYVADQSGAIYIWNLHGDHLQRIFVTNDGFVQCIAHDADSQMVSAVDTKGNCYIFRMTPDYAPDTGELTVSGRLQKRLMFQAHNKYALKCAFSPDSTTLATSSADGTVKLWRTADFTVQKQTSTVRFDDPFENITSAATGPANGINLTGIGTASKPQTFKNAFQYDETAFYSTMAAPFLDLSGQNMSTAMLPIRPTKCYLKPRRHCGKCSCESRQTATAENQLSNQSLNKSASVRMSTVGDSKDFKTAQSENSSTTLLGSNLNNSAPSRRKKTSVTSMYSHIPGLPHPHINAQSEISINFPSQTRGQSRDKWSANSDENVDSKYSQNSGSNSRGPSSTPNLYMHYFKNKYYELFSGGGVCKNLTDEEENSIDEEFYGYLKQEKLVVDSDDDDIPEGDEENEISDHGPDDDGEDDEGLTTMAMNREVARRYNFISPRSVAPITPRARRSGNERVTKCGDHCCCSCDCSNTAESFTMTGRTRRMSGNNKVATTSGQSNSSPVTVQAPTPLGDTNSSSKYGVWNFSNSLGPIQTLTTDNQRWVWDVAFTAESDYIFSASSDHMVRLWSVFTGDLTREYNGHQKAVTALAFSDLLV